MSLLYKGRGGGWFGWWYQGTYPFAKLEIYEDKVIFTMFPFMKEIPFQDIKSIEKIVGFPAFSGVELRLRNQRPGFLVFWSMGNANEILEILKKYCTACETTRPWFKRPVQYVPVLFVVFIILFVYSVLTSG